MSLTHLPGWARWSEAGAARPWTVGVEDEVVLVDAVRGSVVNRAREVTAVLPAWLSSRTSPETHACVLELKTAPHATVEAMAGELSATRRSLDDALRHHGMRAAATGTHPLARPSEVEASSAARYRLIDATMRALAHREPTMALHIHVAVPSPVAAVRALDGLRGELPLLLAVAANSPFWHGEDSGFASIRTLIFSMFPRVGIPRHFGSYRAYTRLVERLMRVAAVPDPSFLWWDARLQPRFGTVEVRITDAQTRTIDVAALAALVQCSVRHHAVRADTAAIHPEVLAESRFLAARDGIRAKLADARTGRPAAAVGQLEELLEARRAEASELRCEAELARVAALAADPGHERQRRLAARHGVAALPGLLGDEFAAPAEPAAVA